MGGQSHNNSFPESVVVQDLEGKIAALRKDCEMALSYRQLYRDPAVVLALRYLALSVIANKLNLYADHRSASMLIDEISGKMNSTDPRQLLASIRYLKLRHSAVYQLNPLWFDRAASSATDCIQRSTGKQQHWPAFPILSFTDQQILQRYGFDQSTKVSKHHPHRSNIIWMAISTMVGAVALAMILATEQGAVRETAEAATSSIDRPQVKTIDTLPSSPPSSVSPNLPEQTLVEPSGVVDLAISEKIAPIPNVISMSAMLKSTIVKQPPQNYSQLLTANLDSSLYKKAVPPSSPLKPSPLAILGKDQTNNYLKTICGGQLHICSYTIQEKTIRVTLLPEYTKKVQQTAADAAEQDDNVAKQGLIRHIASLNDSLEAISSNSTMPLYLYGVDGEVIQKYTPQNP
jgi:hypothetical protein